VVQHELRRRVLLQKPLNCVAVLFEATVREEQTYLQ
jgi:hypothetical protein